MKENQLLNERCRFFVQYWGLKVLYVGGIGLVVIGKDGWNLNHPDFFLILKHISYITDQDAIECGYNDAKQFLIYYKRRGEPLYEHHDYLRSKGYAVPFMNYSVEDMLKLGWIKN